MLMPQDTHKILRSATVSVEKSILSKQVDVIARHKNLAD